MSKTGASFKRGESCQTYATPECFMAPLRKRFGTPTLDLAASAENTKAPLFYTQAVNSLTKVWHEHAGLCFLNPPFDRIEPWAAKCADEAKAGAHILFLVPASVGSEWFHNHVHRKAFVLALRGRIPFDPANPTWGYPKDCILAAYGFGVGFDTWKWRI